MSHNQNSKAVANTIKLVKSITAQVETLNSIDNATRKIESAKTAYSARKWRHKRAGHLAYVAKSL